MDYERDFEEKDREPHGWIKLLPLLVAVVLIVVILSVMVLLHRQGEDDKELGERGCITT